MKRLHVHVSVKDMDQSIGFYSTLFGVKPDILKDDYAKWQLDDPRVNFAISARGAAAGLNHLGFQVEAEEEFSEVCDRLEAAEEGHSRQTDAACCYARSDKVWATDPQGVPWEMFRTHGQIEVFGSDTPIRPLAAVAGQDAAAGEACCE